MGSGAPDAAPGGGARAGPPAAAGPGTAAGGTIARGVAAHRGQARWCGASFAGCRHEALDGTLACPRAALARRPGRLQYWHPARSLAPRRVLLAVVELVPRREDVLLAVDQDGTHGSVVVRRADRMPERGASTFQRIIGRLTGRNVLQAAVRSL